MLDNYPLHEKIVQLEATITEQSKVIERVTIAANEMYHDNLKGDSKLSALALINLDYILEELKEAGE